MKKSRTLFLMFFLIGCSSSRHSVPLATERRAPLLSEEQAKSLARKLAREKGFDITHYWHGYAESLHLGFVHKQLPTGRLNAHKMLADHPA